MKKSFFKVSGLAGLMLLGGLTMVSCYEGDDSKIDYVVPVTPEPTPAKYYLNGSVTDTYGRQIEATVTVNGESVTTTGSFSKELTSLTSDRKYTIVATCTGYVTVTRDVYMTEVGEGQIGSQNVEIVMTSLEKIIEDNTTPTTNETVKIDASTATKVENSIETAVKESLGDNNYESIATETEVKEDGSLGVAVTLTAKTTQSGKVENGYVVDFTYPVSTGFEIVTSPVATKATLTPEEMWISQAANFLGKAYAEKGMVTVWQKASTTVSDGKLLKGLKINYTIVEKKLAFAAGEDLETYEGTVRYVEGDTTVTPILVDDSHDDHHDDHHTNGGAAGGGTTSGN